MAETENSAAAAGAIEIIEPTAAEKEATAAAAAAAAVAAGESAENAEDISYHAVEKEGSVTAIWEMQGRKHLRTIDPRSGEGKQILALFETAG
ncbi:MAG TPA: hypothetical protein VK400_19575 [Pyrinomonadaceae bacterium]|nr:hypothetical protein [Pyrinomonadaceae bacterium]